MLRKEEKNIDYLENWPLHYYEISDINQRQTLLQNHISQEKNDEDMMRLQILKFRYGDDIKEKRADRFMRGWINAKTLTTENIHFFNKKRIENELNSCLRDLAIIDFDRNTVLHQEWENFAKDFILSCISSHSYKQIAIGIGNVSDNNVAMRIAGDIDSITRKLPSSFGLEKECEELYQIMVQTFQFMLDQGEQYWQDYCNTLR